MQPASFASVLVIDDEPVVLDLFQRVLTEKGLSTRLARNAEEALALLEREEFGCVLADKNLPGLNGIEVLRRVRQTQPYCACIIMTAYASTQSAVEALRIGAIDYIEKPFDDLDGIADRIDEAVKQMKVQYERRAAATPLRLIDGQGPANELPEEAHPAEAAEGGQDPAATPIEILQARVRHATTDLRRRSLHLLSRLVASKAAGREVLLSGEALLDELRRIREAGQHPAPELRRIEEKLEEHLALARHAQSR
ncbi:MAG: response regulator [Deltaproteobacteria bacterium]|nr:MAG: response regulator [Deltaproteobacteria bacterium]